MTLSEAERHQLNRIEGKLDETCRMVFGIRERVSSLEQSRRSAVKMMWLTLTAAATAVTSALATVMKGS